MEQQPKINPPAFWIKLLRWFCREDLIEDIEGDLLEMFYLEVEDSPRKAKRLLVTEVIKLFRPRMIRSFKFQHTNMMYANFFKVAYRNALAYKSYTLLNLLGLVLGITTSILIYLWVEDEVNKDKFHANGEQIYTIKRNLQQSGGTIVTTNSVPHPVADHVKDTYSEVSAVCEVSWSMDNILERNEEFSVESGRFVSPNFFKVFSYELLVGDKDKVLADPTSIVLSENLAKKYFSNDINDYSALLGETIKVENEIDVTIAGIFKQPSEQSSLQFEWLISNTGFIERNEWLQDWGNGAFYTHLLLKDHTSISAVSERLFSEIEDHTDYVSGETLWLQKYEDAYLNHNYENGKAVGGKIIYVQIMQAVAIFILLIACINYMNLTTARASRRAKEIGVRKVMGALQGSISHQFYIEALMYAIVAVGISLIAAYLLLPSYNTLVDKQLGLNLLQTNHILYIVLLILVIGILSGSYPAQRLSRLTLLGAMKKLTKKERNGISVRRSLVVLQVAISFMLLFGTLVIGNQIQYILTKDTGINKENIIAIWLEGDLEGNFETYKNELSKISGVKAITAASGNPVYYGRSTSSAKWEGQNSDEPYELQIMITYDDYFKNLGLDIIKGRDFINRSATDSSNYIINETAAAVMGFEDPIGKELSVWGRKGNIVGLVKDYHSNSLKREIAPLILMYSPQYVSTALVTIEGNTQEIIANIEKVNKAMNPNYIFDFEFLDDTYKQMYETELMIGKLSSIFVGISVIIAVLGLLGLAAYSTEKRTKEIGIRKVHGASVTNLLVLLSKEYATLITIAFLFAMPFSYWAMNNWLENFVYHINLGVSVFAYAGFILFAICIITVLVKAYQTTQRNPIKTLRSE